MSHPGHIHYPFQYSINTLWAKSTFAQLATLMNKKSEALGEVGVTIDLSQR